MSSSKINLDTARQNKLVSKDEWLSQRLTLLQSEKELKQKMDALAEQRRQLPLVKIDRDYRFQSEAGEKTLEQLFSGHQQLIVYHFMFGEDWEQGCLGGLGTSIENSALTEACRYKANFTGNGLSPYQEIKRSRCMLQLLPYGESMGNHTLRLDCVFP